MKKLIILTLLFVSYTTLVTGQDKERRAEKLEARKVAFISTELDLTSAEAQGFWPIYNEYNERTKVSKKKLKEVTGGKSIDSISESEAEEFIRTILDVEQDELNIKREYTNQLKTVIPSTKIAKLFLLEKKFKERVLKKIKRKMKDKRK